MNILQKLQERGLFCAGCSACANRCPSRALEMRPDARGFLYPAVHSDRCIDCDFCLEVCPQLNPVNDNWLSPKCYAAWSSDEERMKSSSGAIFPRLAETVIQQGGIVFGAVFDDNFNVKHIGTEHLDGIAPMRKSKYVQSNMVGIHQKILGHLKEGRTVLFSGTPCQVASVKSFCRDYLDQLFLVDILCTGVSSSQEWQEYLSESFDMKSVTEIDFRDKNNGWRCDTLTVSYKNGAKQKLEPQEFIYGKALLSHLTTRDGCNNCEFGGLQRQGDLSIGDFWGISQYDPSLNDRKGTGLILCNNEKGELLLNQISQDLKMIKQLPLSATIGRNRVQKQSGLHPYHERFKELYPRKDFTTAVTDVFDEKHDIGLVSIFSCPNYGGQFTQFALYNVLKEMGYSVLMIEANNRRTMDVINSRCLFTDNPYPDYDKAAGSGDLSYLNDRCRLFIVGSDQHFNMGIMHKIGTSASLDFVDNRRPKIGYAISFGHDYFNGTDSERAYLSNMFQKFDAVSVREKSSVELCASSFGVPNAVHVMDPVFLLNMEVYHRLADKFRDEMPSEPFLYGFILDPYKKEPLLRFLESYLQIPSRTVPDIIYRGTDDITIAYPFYTDNKAPLEKWLSFFKYSKFVITDSFHGTCMALRFHKEFVSFYDPRRGNSRLESILKPLGLEYRMVASLEDLEARIDSFPPIDWESVDTVLNEHISLSRSWLQDNIEKYINDIRSFSDLDVLFQRVKNISASQANSAEEHYLMLTEELRSLEKKLDDIETHRFSNKAARKIKGGVKCLKDHGMIYTSKRFVFHLNRYINYLKSK